MLVPWTMAHAYGLHFSTAAGMKFHVHVQGFVYVVNCHATRLASYRCYYGNLLVVCADAPSLSFRFGCTGGSVPNIG
jgi:ribose 1,5-bisphosphokinase PhnN